MKVSNLKKILDSLPINKEYHIVTGEKWLPERLVHTELDNELLFLEFDNAPDEGEEGIEGRGFVDHEIDLLRSRITDILCQNDCPSATADALLGFFLVGHELSSSDFVELLESMDVGSQSTPVEESRALQRSSAELSSNEVSV
ncbi:VC1380 family protein [Vibrio methylphosphonaticus]|uniref:hypothetical protein n=1 Tax=Vibrio methylphosphonaticus TaxID=2946866 RepID=UPI00202A457A|nr:hypothetical protein [Vibrio methylphosphonaticus]MCL9777367.1 hypothetical protein [Vibrio methylphosphonaticus]